MVDPLLKMRSSARSSRSAARKLKSCVLIRCGSSAASRLPACQGPKVRSKKFSGANSISASSRSRKKYSVLTANCSAATRALSTRGFGRTRTCAPGGTRSKPAPPRSSATSLRISFSGCPEATRAYVMQFGLSESQEFLKDSGREFFAGECPTAEIRRLMETDSAYDAALWAKLTDQGYTGIIFPEAYGGVGLGKVELMLLMEEAGRALLPGPFFSTVVL